MVLIVVHITARIWRTSVQAILVPARSSFPVASDILDSSILLVVSEQDVQWDVLSGHGYRVQRTSNLAEAIECYSRDTQVSVVVIDMNVVEAESLSLIEALREQGRNRGWTEFLLASGEDIASAARLAIKLQVSDFLVSPISSEQLIEAVSDAYNVARVQRFKHEETRSLESSLVELKTFTYTAISQLIVQVQGRYEAPALAAYSPLPLIDVSVEASLLSFVEGECRRARLREKVFGSLALSHSGWMLLLVLAESKLVNMEMTIKSAAYSAGLPLSSALRKINEMCSSGLVDRREDSKDSRRSFVTLTPQGQACLESYFSAFNKGRMASRK